MSYVANIDVTYVVNFKKCLHLKRLLVDPAVVNDLKLGVLYRFIAIIAPILLALAKALAFVDECTAEMKAV